MPPLQPTSTRSPDLHERIQVGALRPTAALEASSSDQFIFEEIVNEPIKLLALPPAGLAATAAIPTMTTFQP